MTERVLFFEQEITEETEVDSDLVLAEMRVERTSISNSAGAILLGMQHIS